MSYSFLHNVINYGWAAAIQAIAFMPLPVDVNEDEGISGVMLENEEPPKTEMFIGNVAESFTDNLVGIKTSVSPEAKKYAKLMLHYITSRVEETGDNIEDVMEVSLMAVLQERLNLEEKLIEYEAKLAKYNAGTNRKNSANKFAVEMLPNVLEAREKGIKAYGKMAEYFNEKGLPSATNKEFGASSVFRMVKRMEELGLFEQENNNPALES